MKKLIKILLVAAIAAIAVAANKPAEFMTSDGASYTVSTGIDAEALSTSPETDPIRCYTADGLFDQLSLNFLVSAGTTTGVSITTYHSPAGSLGVEPAAATYGSTSRCEPQGSGVVTCDQDVAFYSFASGSTFHMSTLIPCNSRYAKVKFEGTGSSTITVTGAKFAN